MFRDALGPARDACLRLGIVLRAVQAKVSLRKAQLGMFEQAPEDRRVAHRLAQQIEMPRAADAVAQHAGDSQLAIEVGKAVYECGDAARHAAGVAHEHDGSTQPLGDLRAGARFARWGGAVEEAHHAFDQCDIGTGRGALEAREHRIATHHPAIEVVTRLAGRERVVRRIEVVGSALEHGHAQATFAQRTCDADHERGLAHA
jgi:hypothetical protein